MTEKPLAELKPGEIAEIVALNGGDEFQSRLRAMGLAEGQTVRKLSRIRWGGPIVLLVNRAQVAVGRGMAKKITVRVKDKNKGGDRGAEDNG
jgi:ferrous iron transport protein A